MKPPISLIRFVSKPKDELTFIFNWIGTLVDVTDGVIIDAVVLGGGVGFDFERDEQ